MACRLSGSAESSFLTQRFESTGDSFLWEVAPFSAGFSLVLG